MCCVAESLVAAEPEEPAFLPSILDNLPVIRGDFGLTPPSPLGYGDGAPAAH